MAKHHLCDRPSGSLLFSDSWGGAQRQSDDDCFFLIQDLLSLLSSRKEMSQLRSGSGFAKEQLEKHRQKYKDTP